MTPLATNSGRSTWFVGVLVLMVYLIFRDDALPDAAPGAVTYFPHAISAPPPGRAHVGLSFCPGVHS